MQRRGAIETKSQFVMMCVDGILNWIGDTGSNSMRMGMANIEVEWFLECVKNTRQYNCDSSNSHFGSTFHFHAIQLHDFWTNWTPTETIAVCRDRIRYQTINDKFIIWYAKMCGTTNDVSTRNDEFKSTENNIETFSISSKYVHVVQVKQLPPNAHTYLPIAAVFNKKKQIDIHCKYGFHPLHIWSLVRVLESCLPASLPASMCASCNLHEFFILFLSIERTSDILRYLSRFSKRSICERPQTKQNYINEGEKNESE